MWYLLEKNLEEIHLILEAEVGDNPLPQKMLRIRI